MILDHPVFLWLLTLLPLELVLVWRRTKPLSISLSALTAPGQARTRLRRLARILGTGASLLFIASMSLALAGPSWGEGSERVERSGLEVALVLDVSRSMVAEDAVGSRLSAAVALARLLMARAPGASFSMVVVKGEAVVLVPMTEDRDAIDSALSYASPSIISRKGTDLGSGIEAALSSFTALAGRGRIVVVLSDGGDLDLRARAAAAQAKERGARIYAIGFGSAEPVTIPGPEGRPLVEKNGKPIRVSLDSSLLRALASVTGGHYYDAAEASTLQSIVSEFDREGQTGIREIARTQDRGPLFLFLALLAFIGRLAARMLATARVPSRMQGTPQ
ncbi:MAG: vWA domain-containing protein [Rectinemataceae bacterium]